MACVDAHVHVFVRPSDRYPREVSSLAPAEREGSVEQLLGEMEKSGVDRAVLIQLGGYSVAQHRYMADCVARYPGRFAAVGLVDPHDPEPAARLRELVEATGIRGIRLHRLGDPAVGRLEEAVSFSLWRAAEEMGIVLCIYTGLDQLPLMERLIRAFPRVAVALDHSGMCPSTPLVPDAWGRPRFNEQIPPPTLPAILRLAGCPNVYLKVSGEYAFSHEPYPYPDYAPIVRALHQAFGAGRLMWATDFPWIVEEPGYGRLARLIDVHLPDLTSEERAAIMGGTAERVWWSDPQATS